MRTTHAGRCAELSLPWGCYLSRFSIQALLLPRRAGKEAFSLGTGPWPHHRSHCLSWEKTTHLFSGNTQKREAGGGKFQREKTHSPCHNEETTFRKVKEKKKKRGDTPMSSLPPSFCVQCHGNDLHIVAERGQWEKKKKKKIDSYF